MESRFFDPSIKLSPYIIGYVYWDDEVSVKKEILFTVKGTASLGLPLDRSFRCAVKGQKLKSNCLSLFQPIVPVLYGQMTSYGKVIVEGNVKLIFVIFTALGLNIFLKDDASLVTDKIIPLESLEKSHLKKIINFNFDELGSLESNILDLDESLKACFLSDPPVTENSQLQETLEFLVKNKGKLTIQELADRAGVTTRTLEMQFKKSIGLTPKTYSRIVRFNSLIRQLNETPKIDSFEWIEKYGYTDQSHFIKDFKDFTGMSPKKYFNDPSWQDYILNKSISK